MIAVSRKRTSRNTLGAALRDSRGIVSSKGTAAPFPIPPAAPVGSFSSRDAAYGVASYSDAFVRTTGAASVSKQTVSKVTGYGIGSMQYYPPTVEDTGLTTITDCNVYDTIAVSPGSSGGTGEACYWLGNRTYAARIFAQRAGWMGMFTGSKNHNSVIEDLELQDFAVGIYVEHVTHDVTFRRFKISGTADRSVAGGTEPGNILAARSISIEWWYSGEGSYNLTFEDGDIYCPSGASPRAGVYADAGTYGLTFRRCRFWGPGKAVYLPNNRQGGGRDAIFEDCVFEQSGTSITYHNNPIG